MELDKRERWEALNRIIKIGHGDALIYHTIHDGPFLAHLIAWNYTHGEVRDSKVFLPVSALRQTFDKELSENAVAHLCMLSPRDLWRAVEAHRLLNKNGFPVSNGSGNMLEKGISKYLRHRENPALFDKAALRFKKYLKALYTSYHVKPGRRAQTILFERKKPLGSVFHALSQLHNLPPMEMAGTILAFDIPYPVAISALGGKLNEEVWIALVDKMSPQEAMNNTASLAKIGALNFNTVKLLHTKKLDEWTTSKKATTLKGTQAVKKIVSKKLAAKVEAAQEKRLDTMTIPGDWLILADASGSMSASIEVAKELAAFLARQAEGEVRLVFFDTGVRSHHLIKHGTTLAQITQATRFATAGGSTSIGAGLDWAVKSKAPFDGIIIVSDGGENRAPLFVDVYKRYSQREECEPMVYMFHVRGDHDVISAHMEREGLPFEKYEVSRNVDYASLPNFLRIIKKDRYALVDEVMATPLKTFAEVFRKEVNA